MATTFLLSVGTTAVPDHPDGADDVRDGSHHTRHGIAQPEAFDDLRQEEADPIVARRRAEIHERQGENLSVHERCRDTEVSYLRPLLLLG